jgi:signal transduction histidine kinase
LHIPLSPLKAALFASGFFTISGACMKDSAARQSNEAVITTDVLRQLAYNEKMAELGKISAGVVHELNSPLSVIISASQMIMREEGVPEAVLEMISRISSEAQRLSQMTKGLLNFSSHDETVGEADLNLTANFILNFLNFEAARRGVIVLKQLDYTLPTIRLDANMLKQILLNIIMNALQAMEKEGGKLLVETTGSGSEGVRFIITDNGPGIPAGSLERIFDRYFTTKGPNEGTGLGLFVTKKLVESMGGDITVASESGRGTTFTVTLPVDQQNNRSA